LTCRPVERFLLVMGCAHRLGSLARVPALGAALAAGLGAGAAFGGEPLPPPDPIRLEYTSAPGCADVAAFRNEIASRFGGRDPFVDDAPACPEAPPEEPLEPLP
jgi:hypothetical protein